MILQFIYFLSVFSAIGTEGVNEGTCAKKGETCSDLARENKYLFYSVNSPEGFNLRRDVYMRFAIMLHEAKMRGNWKLVLPPWHRIYHWKSSPKRTPWSTFFDIESLKNFVPVVEFNELQDIEPKPLHLDRIYILQNFEDAFEGGTFTEKWKLNNNCDYDEIHSEYLFKSVKEIVCIQFQGKISKLWEIVALHPNDKYIMFVHGEIPLHDNYGTKTYWDCRRSMTFNKQLIQIAKEYIQKYFKCTDIICNSYLSVHWRRQDFARARKNDIPSIAGATKQINKAIIKHIFNITKVFIATDAINSEKQKLVDLLATYSLEAYFYTPVEQVHEGAAAIIEQIICSHSMYFIGTHESTFTFRIQEEREIVGHESWTTYNRLCPDTGRCDKPSKWTIVH